MRKSGRCRPSRILPPWSRSFEKSKGSLVWFVRANLQGVLLSVGLVISIGPQVISVFFTNTQPDPELLRAMTEGEFVGRSDRVNHESGINRFVPDL